MDFTNLFTDVGKLLTSDPESIIAIAAIIVGYAITASKGVDFIKLLAKKFGYDLLPMTAKVLSYVFSVGLALPTLLSQEYPILVVIVGTLAAAISGPWFHDSQASSSKTVSNGRPIECGE